MAVVGVEVARGVIRGAGGGGACRGGAVGSLAGGCCMLGAVTVGVADGGRASWCMAESRASC